MTSLTLQKVLDDPLEAATIPWAEFMSIMSRTPHPPEWRRGQFWFNTVAEVRPDVAEQIRGTFSDCFYSDSNIDIFIEKAGKLW